MSGKYRALLIGNWEYPEKTGLPPLRGPKNDVAVLDKALRHEEFGLFQSVKSFQNLGRNDMVEEIDKFCKQGMTDDTLLLYFSGHGLSDQGTLYLCPVDMRARLPKTGIGSGELDDSVKRGNAERTIVILDCCYSGGLIEEGTKGVSALDMAPAMLGEGTFVLTSGSRFQTSLDASDPEMPSPFTELLTSILVDDSLEGNERGELTAQRVVQLLDERWAQQSERAIEHGWRLPPQPWRRDQGKGAIPIAKRATQTLDQGWYKRVSDVGPRRFRPLRIEVRDDKLSLHPPTADDQPNGDQAASNSPHKLAPLDPDQQRAVAVMLDVIDALSQRTAAGASSGSGDDQRELVVGAWHALGQLLREPWRATPVLDRLETELGRLDSQGEDDPQAVMLQLDLAKSAMADWPWELLSTVGVKTLGLRSNLVLQRVTEPNPYPPKMLPLDDTLSTLLVSSYTTIEGTEPEERDLAKAVQSDLERLRLATATYRAGLVSLLTNCTWESFVNAMKQPIHVVHLLLPIRLENDEVQVAFANDRRPEWILADDLVHNLKRRGYHCILLETIAATGRRSYRATTRLAGSLAELGPVIAVCHSPYYPPMRRSTDTTFAGYLVAALAAGKPVEIALHHAREHFSTLLHKNAILFGVPTLYRCLDAPAAAAQTRPTSASSGAPPRSRSAIP